MKIWPLLDSYQRAATCLHSVEDYRKISTSLPAAADFMAQTDSLAQNAPIVEQPRLVRIALAVLAVGYLPWLLAAMILSVFIFWKSARRQQLRWLAALVLFGCGYNASSCLEGAIVNSLDVHRYIGANVCDAADAIPCLWLILNSSSKPGTIGALSFSLKLLKQRPFGNLRDWCEYPNGERTCDET